MQKRILAPILLFALSAAAAFGFNCKQLGQFTELYLKLHYSADDFDDQLSERTLKNLIKALDPAKLYFTQGDVDRLTSTYEVMIDDQMKAGNCAAINDVLGTYAKRFKERQPEIMELVNRDFDFTIDEYYISNRKKRDFAATEEELGDRWRREVKFQTMRLQKRYDTIEEVREKLTKRYELSRKWLEELDGIEIASIFLNAFSTALDPHSKYLSPDDLEDFNISTGLSLEGIGATLRSEYGVTTIQSLVPGGPAEKSGELEPGDRIVGVAQGESDDFLDVVDMKLREVVKYIRGKRGTQVRLSLERDTEDGMETRVVEIVRDKIELNDREARGYSFDVEVDDPAGGDTVKIGYIRLPSFYIDFEARKTGEDGFKSSSEDVKRLLGELEAEGVEAMVLDLRSNTGGSLDEAVAIAGLFFDEGPVVQVRSVDGSKVVLSDDDGKTYYDGPLVALVNRHSASSSEILVGALKDYGRAIVVGDSHTFGKGTVQTVKQVGGGKFGAVKATISQFFRPGGASTQLRGVEADIVLPDLLDELEIGERFNDYHLPWREIDSPGHLVFDQVDAYLDVLVTSSEARVADSDGFQKIVDRIEEYRAKEDERGRISLKEDEDGEADGSADPPEKTADAGDSKETDAPESKPENAEGDAKTVADAEDSEAADGDDETKDKKRPNLARDVFLRETLAITADYVRLLAGEPIAAISFPELEEDGDQVAKAETTRDDEPLKAATQ